MAVKAVVFDLDGTIASFNIDYKAIRADVRDLLLRLGVPASVLSPNESIFEMLKKTEVFMKNNGKPEKKMDEIRQKALAIADKYELDAAKTTTLLPGALETLKDLRKMDLKIGLCTINSKKSTEYILKQFGIAKFFDALTPRDAIKYVKPNPEHLETALHALDVNAQEVVVVGDGVSDMKSARELKAVAVALPTGVSSPKELVTAGANYLITSLTDLPSLIERLNKTKEEKGS